MVKLPNPIKYHIYTGSPISIDDMWPYAYLLAARGLYKLAITPHFYASLPIAPARVAGLADWSREGALLKVPRIPAKWLEAVLAHAQKAGHQPNAILRPVEQMYHFHWLNEWRVAVPRQQASAGRVSYAGGNESSVVLDLHSHHEMGAFFSETDNADEQGCRFYAVIGRIFSRPELRLRLGVYGDWVELDPLVLFEGMGPFSIVN